MSQESSRTWRWWPWSGRRPPETVSPAGSDPPPSRPPSLSLAGALREAAVGLWLLDAEGRTVEVNLGLADLVGLGRGDLVGRPAALFFDAPPAGDPALASRRPVERRLRRPDGRALRVWVSASAVHDASGVRQGTLLALLEAPCPATAGRLERPSPDPRQDAHWDELMLVAAHELRAPLGSVRLALTALSHQVAVAVPPGEAQGEMFRLLEATARRIERLGRLMTNLLSTSRLLTEEMRLVMAPVDLSEVVALAVRRFDLEPARVHISAPSPVLGRWDGVRLEQVVTNLLSNAIQYGRGRPVHVEVWRAGSMAYLRVRDEGVGIAPEALRALFERRPRGSERSDWGLGLGLWIVRRLVAMHGGEVRVESEVGRGSTFTVQLPRGLG